MPEMVADALVILKRNLIKFRAPARDADRLHGPADHVRAAVRLRLRRLDRHPGMPYEDWLIPGIIVQNITFGGALTAVGLVEDMKKGLIDRFRSLPMARSAVLAGRTLADVVVNLFGVIIVIAVGYVVGFRFSTSVPEVALRHRPAAAVRLRLQLDLRARRSVFHERGDRAADRVHRDLPADVHLVRVRADRKHAGTAGSVCRSEPVHHHGRCDAPSLRRHASRQFRVGSDVVVDRSDHRVRAAGRSQIPSRFLALGWPQSHQSRARAGVLERVGNGRQTFCDVSLRRRCWHAFC